MSNVAQVSVLMLLSVIILFKSVVADRDNAAT